MKVTLRLDQIDKLDPAQQAALKQQTKTTDLADMQIAPDSGAPPKLAKKVSVGETREQAVKRLMGPTAAKLFKASDEMARIQQKIDHEGSATMRSLKRMLGPSIGELTKELYPGLGEMTKIQQKMERQGEQTMRSIKQMLGPSTGELAKALAPSLVEMVKRQERQWREDMLPSATTVARRETQRWPEAAFGLDWALGDSMQAIAAAAGSTVVDYDDVMSTSAQRALMGIDPISAAILDGVDPIAAITGIPDAHAEYLKDQMAQLQAFETSAYDDYMREQQASLEALTTGVSDQMVGQLAGTYMADELARQQEHLHSLVGGVAAAFLNDHQAQFGMSATSAFADELERQRVELQGFVEGAQADLLSEQLAQLRAITGNVQAEYEDRLAALQAYVPSVHGLVSQFDASTALGRIIERVRDRDDSDALSRPAARQKAPSISWDDVFEAATEIEHATRSPGGTNQAQPSALALWGIRLACIGIVLQLLQLFFGDNLIERIGQFRPALLAPVEQGELPPPTVDRATIAVATSLYTEPSSDSATMGELPLGTWILVLEERDGWLLVEVETGDASRLRGWIFTRGIEPRKSPTKILYAEAHQQTLATEPARQRLARIEPNTVAAAVPALIADAGDHASRRYVEFFTASIRNKNTRAAYWHACSAFLDACAAGGLALAQVEPVHVAAYIERLSQDRSAPTVKQHLAAIRRMFDFLVVGQVIPSSPASSVRGPKHVVIESKTPILDADEARKLFDQFDISALGDLRDRAILGTMVYSFARVGALVKLRVRDYYREGGKTWFVLDGKGGEQNRVPAHHLVAEYVEQYIERAGIGLQVNMPLFRSFGRGKGRNQVTERGLGREEIFAIVRRRATAAGLSPEIGCHSFRGTGITNYLQHGGTIETAAKLAGHSSTRTTQLYDRRHAEVALAEIERIRF